MSDTHAETQAHEKDPVCGMTVDPATAKWRHEHDHTTYHFCCAGCPTSSPPIRGGISVL